MTIDVRELVFEPPGPGSWQIDGTHAPRPWPRFHAEMFPEQLERGFQEMARRYGLVLELKWRMVHGFGYMALAPVADAQFGERIAAAEAAFAQKLWRADHARWEHEAKPAAIRAHTTLQAVDPATLDDDALGEHLDRCRTNLKRASYQHHWFNGACLVPLGDFLVHASEWTGRSIGELAALMRGWTPLSAGRSDELDRLVEAILEDPGAEALLCANGNDAGRVLAELRARPGRAGSAVATYLDAVGYRLLDGHSVGEPYALEQPATLLDVIRAGFARGADVPPAAPPADLVAAIRDGVPDAERTHYDELLDEARLTYALRDERGVFGEVWAAGITRRAILEAGGRLVAAGRIDRAEHLVEAGYDELRALRSCAGGPPAAELAARASFRLAHVAADAPPLLGPAPEPPPPLDALPPAAARAMRAIDVCLGAMFQPSDAQSETRVVRGLGASPGVYEGTARRISGPAEFERIERGDVLVIESTQEAFNLVMPLLGALVTDAGGVLSHAAIVAREFGIPAVVGSLDATCLIADGARVRVDGDAGEVRLIG
jgi:pyruvate,water dikinase